MATTEELDESRRKLRDFVRRSVPGAREVADHSWPSGDSVVLEFAAPADVPTAAAFPSGRTALIAKLSRISGEYEREVAALRRWAPRLGAGRAPTLMDCDDEAGILITDRLPGTTGTATSPEAFRQAGELTRRLHAIEPSGTQPDQRARMEQRIERWLRQLPDTLTDADLALVDDCLAVMETLPDPVTGSIHDDNQCRVA